MNRISTSTAAFGLAAGLALAATPAAAAVDIAAAPQTGLELSPVFAASGDLFEEDTASNYRRDRRYRRYRRNRVDAGDIIAGAVILGGIAAIASAASNKNNRRDRYDNRRYRSNDYQRRNSSSNLDRAVNACMREISRDVRVDGVDSVSRAGDGWQVNGRLYDGKGFTCNVGRNGRVDRVDYAGGFSGAANGQGGSLGGSQWSDSAYANARQSAAGQGYTPPAPQQGQQPAYPGGPLPGDAAIDSDFGG